MYQAATPQANFSLAQTRHVVKDLFTPQPWIYWTDFLLSMGLGSLCFLAVRWWVPPYSLAQAVVFLASCILFYRAVLFTHEMVHLRDNKFRTFRIVWNLLCGIPFMMPSFTYYTHVDHHMRSHFGTQHDGEYLPLGTRRPIHILLYLLQPFVIPLFAVARFLFLTPLCWVSPRVRRWAHVHASSMVMDPSYIRPLPSAKTLKIFRLQETACFLLALGVAIRVLRGRMPLDMLMQTYLTSVVILMINNLRTLGAHRYISGGHEMTFVDQLLDSVNYPGPSLLTPLWAPVGLRYHALHHLCPSLPYHNMGQAHRRLMEQLPADSPYRATNCDSLWTAIRQLWRTAAESQRLAQPARLAPEATAGVRTNDLIEQQTAESATT
jgi:fatty acid desaturase